MMWVSNIWKSLEQRKPSFFSVSGRLLQRTKCVDPRDKIYGSAGVALEFDANGPTFHH